MFPVHQLQPSSTNAHTIYIHIYIVQLYFLPTTLAQTYCRIALAYWMFSVVCIGHELSKEVLSRVYFHAVDWKHSVRKGNFAICKWRMQKQKHAANEERKGAPVQCALRSSSDDERARLRAPRPMTSEQVHSIYIYIVDLLMIYNISDSQKHWVHCTKTWSSNSKLQCTVQSFHLHCYGDCFCDWMLRNCMRHSHMHRATKNTKGTNYMLFTSPKTFYKACFEIVGIRATSASVLAQTYTSCRP